MKDGDIDKVSEKLNESAYSKHTTGKGKDELNKSKDSIISKDDYKYDLPGSCYISLMKGTQIEKLHKKYLLVSHPYPMLEGEMLII